MTEEQKPQGPEQEGTPDADPGPPTVELVGESDPGPASMESVAGSKREGDEDRDSSRFTRDLRCGQAESRTVDITKEEERTHVREV